MAKAKFPNLTVGFDKDATLVYYRHDGIYGVKIFTKVNKERACDLAAEYGIDGGDILFVENCKSRFIGVSKISANEKISLNSVLCTI